MTLEKIIDKEEAVKENQAITKKRNPKVEIKQPIKQNYLKPRKRHPFGLKVLKEPFVKDPDYFYYLFNGQEVSEAIKSGYELVDKATGDKISDRIQDPEESSKLASTSVGGGKMGYYMRKPMVEYLKDKLYKENLNAKRTESITNLASFDEKLKAEHQSGKSYGSIKIKHELGS